MTTGIRANWCRTCGGGRNFGDQLTPILFERWGIPHTWAPPGDAELFGVGSIISKVPRAGFAGIVWGTGTIRRGVGRDLSRARVLAVRGERTARECRGVPAGTPFGDPGILVGTLIGDGDRGRLVVGERGELGDVVVPHYVDHDLADRHPGATVVPITSDPIEFVTAVARADRVFTSSLHGLITADALGIPHVLEPHPSVIGGLWKFQDYASAFGETIRPRVERLTADRPLLARFTEQIRLLDQLAAEFGAAA